MLSALREAAFTRRSTQKKRKELFDHCSLLWPALRNLSSSGQIAGLLQRNLSRARSAVKLFVSLQTRVRSLGHREGRWSQRWLAALSGLNRNSIFRFESENTLWEFFKQNHQINIDLKIDCFCSNAPLRLQASLSDWQADYTGFWSF